MSVDRPRPLVAGNWKMNGLKASAEVLDQIKAGYDDALKGRVDLAICPPATLVAAFAEKTAGSGIGIGGQDCHAKESGAYTGNIAAKMLKDGGAAYVIVGHSERRQYERETDADVRAKAEAAHRTGLIAIVCVGETKDEREAGRTLDVVRGQLKGSVPEGSNGGNLVVAYEPVWAIGTGLTPTAADVAEVHKVIRENLAGIVGPAEQAKVRILYGGSVKPSNAAELMGVADVDGALVGGASLVASDFLGIASAYRA
ncbi:triose-phosphate isomerase [Microvirga pudoricolor]|uniref:triose-phosphate isomerase n=1 Tax=Microvirga pudoricolor TaxID=2778729 RepID=UPI001950E2D8|nr:triose-phosphate isomerase [Microvirga pudoricolor]MBM6595748.1 triose-phosphate isomerase [Microvirga pudoricolor]